MNRKGLTTKIVAIIWLLAIVVSIIWTWLLIIFSPQETQAPELTQEELQEILNSYSWTINTQTWTLENPWITNTWAINE